MTKMGKAGFAVVLGLVVALGVGAALVLTGMEPVDTETIDATAINAKKIDVCRYTAESLEDLTTRIEVVGLGKGYSYLAHALSDDPQATIAEWDRVRERSIDELRDFLEEADFPPGVIHYLDRRCPQDFGNINKWSIFLLFDTDHKLIMADSALFYEDLANFAQRNEPITADRYERQKYLFHAVDSLLKSSAHTRMSIREEMKAGGFWFIRSCEDDTTIADFFSAPPFPPVGIFGALGVFSQIRPRPSATITFAKPSEDLVGMESFNVGEDGVECDYSRPSYRQRHTQFFFTEYPDSPMTQFIRRMIYKGKYIPDLF